MPWTPPSPETVRIVTEWLRALADENRVRILCRLHHGECNVSALVEDLGIGQASVSKHLQIMRRANIVEARREGTSIYYRLRDRVPLEVCTIICKQAAEDQRCRERAFDANLFNS